MRAKRDRRGSSARFHGDGPRDVTLEWSRRSGCGQQAGCSRRRATHGDSTKAIGAFVERSNAGRGLSRQPRPDLRPAVPGREREQAPLILPSLHPGNSTASGRAQHRSPPLHHHHLRPVAPPSRAATSRIPHCRQGPWVPPLRVPIFALWAVVVAAARTRRSPPRERRADTGAGLGGHAIRADRASCDLNCYASLCFRKRNLPLVTKHKEATAYFYSKFTPPLIKDARGTGRPELPRDCSCLWSAM